MAIHRKADGKVKGKAYTFPSGKGLQSMSESCEGLSCKAMKLSVLIITYNHEDYIACAIESALMQDVHFEYEIVVGEDCSTDNTRQLLLAYKQKYPEKIRLILHDRNMGMNKNFLETLKACNGEFIALLDGDDYWTTPEKLGMQVDLLTNNPKMSMCFHNALVTYEDGRQAENYCRSDLKPKCSLEECLTCIPTSSVVFRKSCLQEIPEQYFTFDCSDIALYYLLSKSGEIGHISDLMAAYRVHDSGVWSSKSPLEQLNSHLHIYDFIVNLSSPDEKKIIDSKINNILYLLSLYYLDDDPMQARYFLKKLIARFAPNKLYLALLLKLSLNIYFPNLHRFVMHQKKVLGNKASSA